ncbi:hypothetical protein LJC59_08635, partial [Desulfovibrio sp. OttesenSCG-928-A18]|nr:hypothetical protein [Desulfovibrio sp. OttesenSCG-928-A18]
MSDYPIHSYVPGLPVRAKPAGKYYEITGSFSSRIIVHASLAEDPHGLAEELERLLRKEDLEPYRQVMEKGPYNHYLLPPEIHVYPKSTDARVIARAIHTALKEAFESCGHLPLEMFRKDIPPKTAPALESAPQNSPRPALPANAARSSPWDDAGMFARIPAAYEELKSELRGLFTRDNIISFLREVAEVKWRLWDEPLIGSAVVVGGLVHAVNEANAQSPSFAETAKRGAGLTARSGVDVVDSFAWAMRSLLNWGAEKLGYGPEYFKPLADTLPLPRPETEDERLYCDLTSAILHAALPLPFAKAMAVGRIGAFSPTLTQSVARSAAANPGHQLVSAAISEYARQRAEKAGAGPIMSEIYAFLAGVMVPGGGSGGARKAQKTAAIADPPDSLPKPAPAPQPKAE